ncbi:DNA methyltransferase [Candidatus Albibeggiatoa sp. nov. BB20]|uniref:DNA methyltransferase n=1 Tax=Candidatus Albibeggiatoa sp. nov. BB20 TaxID=3162723 RepID=UPI0033653E1D
MTNKLYLGDCLDVLRNELEIKPESVDLIYIDPPFNSKRNYNVFFDDSELQTQRMAFEDTWSLHNVSQSLTELDTIQHDKLLNLLNVYRDIAPHVFPYLVMMTLRIIELHRVLKPTGSFYLHCDPTASHYLKIVCDAIFWAKNFKNEIIWRRYGSHNDVGQGSKHFGRVHDIIFFYTKNESPTWNQVFTPLAPEYIEKTYKNIEPDTGRRFTTTPLTAPGGAEKGNPVFEWNGHTRAWRYNKKRIEELDKQGLLHYSKTGYIRQKLYLENSKGVPVQDEWTDIPALLGSHKERLGYPTQKPKALLERIIQASSNEGDVVLDGFCGCGTSIDAAESLNRKWIGIDIAPFAVSLIKRRLQDTYGDDLNKFEIRGTPTDAASAIKLWEQNQFAFEDWWLTELEVFATTYGRKGADKGIDGIGQYLIPKSDKSIRVAFQVKGGKVQSKDIDALMGVVALEKYDMGILLTRHNPTKPMLNKAAQAGLLKTNYGYTYPKIQIMTLDEFFSGKQLNLPKDNITFKSAATTGKASQQKSLFG